MKAGQSVAVQMPVGGLIILLLLIGQFNSVRRTLIILLTIPLGLIGVTVGLIVADSYMGFMTTLGIIGFVHPVWPTFDRLIWPTPSVSRFSW